VLGAGSGFSIMAEIILESEDLRRIISVILK
jgi:hypothetical protein